MLTQRLLCRTFPAILLGEVVTEKCRLGGSSTHELLVDMIALAPLAELSSHLRRAGHESSGLECRKPLTLFVADMAREPILALIGDYTMDQWMSAQSGNHRVLP